ncbi:DinB family protein [compost metagenome]
MLYRWDGSRPRERIVDVLQHLFVHQTHHRGQVHAMLVGTTAAPPQLDEYFLAMDAPLRDADRAALAAIRARGL